MLAGQSLLLPALNQHTTPPFFLKAFPDHHIDQFLLLWIFYHNNRCNTKSHILVFI